MHPVNPMSLPLRRSQRNGRARQRFQERSTLYESYESLAPPCEYLNESLCESAASATDGHAKAFKKDYEPHESLCDSLHAAASATDGHANAFKNECAGDNVKADYLRTGGEAAPGVVLQGVHLVIRAGALVGVLGPSGSGKTSLLHASEP